MFALAIAVATGGLVVVTRILRPGRRRATVHSKDTRITLPASAQDAFAVASLRAVESARGDDKALFRDEYAEALVRDVHGSLKPAKEALKQIVAAGRAEDLPQGIEHYVAIRTKVVDEIVEDALSAGVRQVVTLGAGFDARPLRLKDMSSMSDLHVFEVDLPEIVACKGSTIGEFSTECQVKLIGADMKNASLLEEALLSQGLDVEKPTLWLLEGIVSHLSIGDLRRVLDACFGLSSGGSLVFADFPDPQLGKIGGRHGMHVGCSLPMKSYIGDPAQYLDQFGVIVQFNSQLGDKNSNFYRLDGGRVRHGPRFVLAKVPVLR
eukprot:CAMPEP_0198309950 /NCGR_PEP_ID=MMETSP1450-20131203/2170_1 /TAXON_ID=753684 ORGANISM="Madagascaria erythrocladiodes, Strain CCMP3234" /NCGR_SAMPLE_ID=MMETSP1450 /ASSEMBLY_ACC=CAM_ASM_001115 /LENGTH=321 /DNA_ID=CAMNT_0044012735 /DNA_START=388 /DNA_END=1353 /DNA_ORIENTATION=+